MLPVTNHSRATLSFLRNTSNGKTGAEVPWEQPVITVADLDKDGAIDVITSDDRGTYIYWNQTKTQHK